jgi:hypothetical protein
MSYGWPVRYWPNAGEGNHAAAVHDSGIPQRVFIRDNDYRNPGYTARHRFERLERGIVCWSHTYRRFRRVGDGRTFL